jgi:hypothetical protein
MGMLGENNKILFMLKESKNILVNLKIIHWWNYDLRNRESMKTKSKRRLGRHWSLEQNFQDFIKKFMQWFW